MTEEEKLSSLRLLFCPGIGNAIAKHLLSYCKTSTAIFEEKQKNLEKIPRIGIKILKSIKNITHAQRAEKELKFIKDNGVQMIVYHQKTYPTLLKMCSDHPFVLFVRGKINFNLPKISIVGTRKITEYGMAICKKLVEELVDYNPIIISGMAYGSDICAHKFAIRNNLQTIGVLGHGLDRMYPAAHSRYMREIENKGGFITEFPSGTTPNKENFPKRNRIIAGLSQATIIIEAAKEGGALITANLANSYNREVFAVPGRTTDIFSVGCNNLIKTNTACMITGAKDLEYVLGWTKKSEKTETKQTCKVREHLKKVDNNSEQMQLPSDLTEPETELLCQFKENKELHIDELSRLTNEPTHKIASLLMKLEIKGLIRALPGKKFSMSF